MLIAVGDYSGNFSIWDATNLAQTSPLITIPNTTQGAGFSYLAWNLDSQRIAAPTSGNDIGIWDASTGATLETLSTHTSVVVTVAWSPDGSMLASIGGDGKVIVWDNLYQPSTILENIDVSNPDIAWNNSSEQLVVSSEQTVYVVDVQTEQVLYHLEIDDSSRSVAWEPSDTLAIGTHQGKIYLWDDISNPEPLTIIDAHADNITDLVWASDGIRLASSGWDYAIKVWEPLTQPN